MLCPLFFWNLGVGVVACVRVGATSCQLIFRILDSIRIGFGYECLLTAGNFVSKGV